MSDKHRLAESYELTNKELHIDGEPFPYYMHKDGPRIETFMDSKLTILWVPVIIDKPYPRYGAPGGTKACASHKPVQHRDGKPPWCNTCGQPGEGRRNR